MDDTCNVYWRGKKIKFRTDDWYTWLRLQKILTWAHKRKFPDVTEKDQIAKLYEERDELKAAVEVYENNKDDMEAIQECAYELADYMFAWFGLRRFNPELAMVFLDKNIMLSKKAYYSSKTTIPMMIKKLLEVYFIRTYKNNRHI
jgi:hypothetical protein